MESARLLLFPISDRICFTSFWFGVGFFLLPAKLLWGLKVFHKMPTLAKQVNTGHSPGTKSITLVLWRLWKIDYQHQLAQEGPAHT